MFIDGWCRLFELVAEEIAIEDTIYYLGKALRQDKIGLNAYMKVSGATCTLVHLDSGSYGKRARFADKGCWVQLDT
jgi:hypothetical protein